MSKLQITKNMFLISNDTRKVSQDLNVSSFGSNFLIIMPTWLMAVDRHIFKYANFYLRYGFDILSIQISLLQLLWPVRGAQVLAADVLKFLENNKNYTVIVIHGFSIGCYLWGEVLVKVKENRSRYQFIIDNVVGQIWDSPADITRIPTGVSYATFPNNKFLQNLLKSYAIYHLKTFNNFATKHYIKSRNAMYNNPIRSPILMLASKIDPISSDDTIKSICDYWEKEGIKVHLKMWDDTAHVSHMLKYPQEYFEELARYLDYIGVTESCNKFRANL